MFQHYRKTLKYDDHVYIQPWPHRVNEKLLSVLHSPSFTRVCYCGIIFALERRYWLASHTTIDSSESTRCTFWSDISRLRTISLWITPLDILQVIGSISETVMLCTSISCINVDERLEMVIVLYNILKTFRSKYNDRSFRRDPFRMEWIRGRRATVWMNLVWMIGRTIIIINKHVLILQI